MRIRNFIVILSALGFVACSGGGGPGPAGAPDGGGGGGGGTDGGGGGTAADLPCEVSSLISTYCITCHSNPPLTGVPSSLTSRADMMQAATSDASVTVGELAVTRMRATTLPMPPAGARPTEADIAAFEAWVTAGYPAGACGLDDPFAAPPQCSTGTNWLGGNAESPDMRPGGECIQCHIDMAEGPFDGPPVFTLAGTVYETGHEPNDCNGGTSASGGGAATVVVTDATGATVTMAVNAAGNFFTEDAVTFPITAVVRYDGRERAMVTPVDSGDCNHCHTDMGAEMAPGRIALP